MTSAKEAALRKLMEELEVKEADLEEQFVRSSGAGGQHVNKTNTCVHLKHVPSGVEVKCAQARSQALNRFLARRLLCEKLEAKVKGKQSKEEQKREKIRRQKRKRSKRAKEKMLKDKRERSEVKQSRKKPSSDS